MAKPKKPAKKVGGPFLAAALFCESIMEDKDKMIRRHPYHRRVRVLDWPTSPS